MSRKWNQTRCGLLPQRVSSLAPILIRSLVSAYRLVLLVDLRLVERRVVLLRLDALRLLLRLEPLRLDALRLRLDPLREDDFRLGTRAPERRASESPIATACLRLLTGFRARPLFSLPRLYSCMALPTFFLELVLYFAMVAPFAVHWNTGGEAPLRLCNDASGLALWIAHYLRRASAIRWTRRPDARGEKRDAY